MYELKVHPYICLGAKSCGICEGYLPEFLSKHGGEIMISHTHFMANQENIEAALLGCPTCSLTITTI